MSVARVHGVVSTGVRGEMVVVEVDVAQGLPSVGVVGLAGASVSESRWRVRSAISNAGFQWPATRITIGLSPADLPKTGTGLDLPIAVGILAATAQVHAGATSGATFVGELGLDGAVHPVPDALSAAIAARAAGIDTIYVAQACAGQVSAVPGMHVVAIRDLVHLVGVLRGTDTGLPIEPLPHGTYAEPADMCEVRGHSLARYGLEVAAAGAHHVAMTGAPGVGKSMLGSRLASLLPDLEDAAALEVTAMLSLTGHLRSGQGVVRRPVTQAPHHAISAAAFLGAAAGSRLKPGVITQADHGVLFMDEAPEFNRQCIEGLRQPLESGDISIARVGATARIPCRFQLVLAANPCPCGLNVDRGEGCSCSPTAKRRYAGRLSGPLMDRIDIRLRVGRPTAAELASDASESSAVIRGRVCEARMRAAARFRDESWTLNALIPSRMLRSRYAPTAGGGELLERTIGESASLRGADRVLRMAWSIADLGAKVRPDADDIAIALGLRGADAVFA